MAKPMKRLPGMVHVLWTPEQAAEVDRAIVFWMAECLEPAITERLRRAKRILEDSVKFAQEQGETDPEDREQRG
jgi:hypothetical protein